MAGVVSAAPLKGLLLDIGMKSRIVFLCCCIFFFLGGTGRGVSQEIPPVNFTHISINEGLSQSTVFSIVQDLKGNMWFATYDGLNKYDGYDFTVYRHSMADPENSLACDIVRTLLMDGDGRIWVGTQAGLSFYDEKKDRFMNFSVKPETGVSVEDIIELPGKRLLVNGGNRLFLFDIGTLEFSDGVLPDELDNLKVSFIKRVGDAVYIGTVSQGIYVYEFGTGKVSRFPFYESEAQVEDMLFLSPTKIWIATEGDGLYAVNPRTGESRHYVHAAGGKGSLSSNYVRSLAVDTSGRVWVGTFNGLDIYSDSIGTFASYTSNPVDPGSLSQCSVRCMFKDSQGGMWLGTFFGGLNYYHPLKKRFHNIRHIPYRNSLSDNVVSCIVEDRGGNLWIGTNDGGVNFYDVRTGKFVYYALNRGDLSSSNMESNNVKAVYVDEAQDKVYIGMHAGGLKILHRTTGVIDHCNLTADAPGDIYSILPHADGVLWIGTLNGLYLFDTGTRRFVPVASDSRGNPLPSLSVFVLFEDSSGRLWVGGEDGLHVFATEAGGKKGLFCMSLPSPGFSEISGVQCVYESRGGELWIATRTGLYKWNDAEKELRHYTTADGLPNNVIYGIEEDTYGYVWLSTNCGLSRFDPDMERFRNFTVNDCLQGNQFNTYSHCCTADGTLYFGGINGITVFRPELLLDNPYAPSPVITGLWVSNKKVLPGDDTGILSGNICDAEEIVLSHSQRMFTLNYVVSNYISGQHNMFAYCLEGYDDKWYYLHDDGRSVSYTNLPPGKYRFLVKASNSDGKWCLEPAALNIIILPVWYHTWWAYLLFVSIGVGLSCLLFRYWKERKDMDARLEMEQREKHHREEIDQMKTRFFIDIFHELRTPLTLIVAPVQEMIACTTDKWFRSQLKYVEKNTNRLLHLVNQLMDYRRAELGVFKLKVRHVDVYQLVKENFLYYEKLARNRGLEYRLQTDLEGKNLYVDPKYLELIENNLLSNAFKYTENGSIVVRLTLSGVDLLLQVSDTGIGIPKEQHKRIFERFFQLENTHIGTGIGLSLIHRLVELHHGRIELESKEGEGSTFSVYFPQDLGVYSPEEMQDESGSDVDGQVYSVNSKDMFFIDNESDGVDEDIPDPEKKRGTILVVEDNSEIRQYLCKGLSSLFTVVQAENGEDALRELKKGEADLVITDVKMPVMDGIKLCRHIKQDLSTSHIPVIMLSAKDDISDRMDGFRTGADDYVPKPFSLPLLVSKVQNMMRTRARMREYFQKSVEIEPEKITFNAMEEELLRNAVKVVEENMDNSEFSAEDFARAMNMSRSNLHLKLKAVTGESAIEFIRKIRMNEAVRLLKDGRYSVAEISVKVGYNTPSYFTSIFKKYFGCLPTEYLKQRGK